MKSRPPMHGSGSDRRLRTRPRTALRGLTLALTLPLLVLAATRPSSQGSLPAAANPGVADPPRVIVLLVIDQLPARLLDRYGELFTGGLARLRAEGRVYANATHDHAITETSPGHASLSTGTYPSRHGMVSNIWYTRDGGGAWAATENVIDAEVRIVGAPNYLGSSPRVLMRTGIADWLLEADDDARIVSVSGKDRAAILLAGKARGTVYWFEPVVGRFATSTFYTDEDPGWIDDFNRGLSDRIGGEVTWSLAVPDEWVGWARPDSAVFERDGVDIRFPHLFEEGREDLPFPVWWSGTPFVDREVLALARLALEEEELGRDDTPDLLAISLSQTDRVGHDFGPRSLEQLDNLLRLDHELGRFFDDLDRALDDRYLLVFTSDHGVLDAPEAIVADGGWARRLTREDGEALNQRAGAVLREERVGGMETLGSALASTVEGADWIARAWPHPDLSPPPADSFAVLAARSLYPGRATGLLGRLGVEVQLTPATLLWAWPYGTNHGSPYHYDRHVPLVFMGQGVTPGVDSAAVSSVSVAPTLAAAAAVAAPDDLDGAPIPLSPDSTGAAGHSRPRE